jgi:hypothetical protein
LARFINGTISETSFQQTQCVGADFNNVKLSESTFLQTNAKKTVFKRARMTKVVFNQSNLRGADFTDVEMEDSPLSSAFSIGDIRFPNRTVGHDSNLINDDLTDCNISLVKHWKSEIGAVAAVANDTGCHFSLLSYDTGAIISRRIKIADIWNSVLWPHSQILVNVRLGHDVSVQLNGMNNIGKVQLQQNLSKQVKTDNLIDIFLFAKRLK